MTISRPSKADCVGFCGIGLQGKIWGSGIIARKHLDYVKIFFLKDLQPQRAQDPVSPDNILALLLKSTPVTSFEVTLESFSSTCVNTEHC